ncbi:hypothetical protein [Tychonema sp. LEGE 07203]|uniref:hypothetical protein n=1 Tax=Tychonema sp. LEGE 07203 TaxID=1828671 RepID=UPI00187E21ED|nr:hypothetical protein [Tychonema sp. LEGE 07203]MBE9094194.1 hypothetical protein [Tychonema sp. LEGE 07203]
MRGEIGRQTNKTSIRSPVSVSEAIRRKARPYGGYANEEDREKCPIATIGICKLKNEKTTER